MVMLFINICRPFGAWVDFTFFQHRALPYADVYRPFGAWLVSFFSVIGLCPMLMCIAPSGLSLASTISGITKWAYQQWNMIMSIIKNSKQDLNRWIKRFYFLIAIIIPRFKNHFIDPRCKNLC